MCKSFNIEDGRKKATFLAYYALLFQEGKNATKKWFVKFHAGDFLLYDAPQSGRSVEVDSNQIETLTENNQHYTTWEIADILKISKSSAENHLHHLDYVNRFDVWVPHKSRGKKPS